MAHEPSPDVEVAVLDEFERFLSQLPDFERKVLELKLHGNTHDGDRRSAGFLRPQNPPGTGTN